MQAKLVDRVLRLRENFSIIIPILLSSDLPRGYTEFFGRRSSPGKGTPPTPNLVPVGMDTPLYLSN